MCVGRSHGSVMGRASVCGTDSEASMRIIDGVPSLRPRIFGPGTPFWYLLLLFFIQLSPIVFCHCFFYHHRPLCRESPDVAAHYTAHDILVGIATSQLLLASAAIRCWRACVRRPPSFGPEPNTSFFLRPGSGCSWCRLRRFKNGRRRC